MARGDAALGKILPPAVIGGGSCDRRTYRDYVVRTMREVGFTIDDMIELSLRYACDVNQIVDKVVCERMGKAR